RGRYPRLEAILERGIPTGFATDWMLNDPFEGMRYAINAMRLRLGSPSAMSGLEALRFQTLGAARVLGLDGEIGSLEAGKKADIILVSTEAPHLQPYYGGPEALVFYAKATDVHTSVIDGRVVMEGRRIPGLDEAVIQRDIRAATPGWRKRLHALGSRAVFGPGCDCCG
ncbi:MAG: cytosine deaminase, partial [Xanthobacteraceae bacterium]